MNLRIVIKTLVFVIHFSIFVVGDYFEGKLYATLLEHYEPLERPVENGSKPVVVKMGLTLQQIISVDEKNQIVDVNAWMKLTWYDYQMIWDPEEWGGVSDLRFKKNQLWTPDVLMYNSADPQFNSAFASNVLVYPDGLATWIPPAILRLSCTIQVVWFPFDMQYCKMKFGSWTFDGSKLDLQIDDNGFDISEYIQNGEWNLVVFNLVLPCILITMLTLIGFALPPDAGEKMSLQITIMLSICIFQNYVTELSPPTSEAIPFLGAFFALCMFTCAGSVVFTALALNVHHRNSRSHEMGPWFRLIVIEWLPYFLLMRRPNWRAENRAMVKKKPEFEPKPRICVAALLSQILVDAPVCSPRTQPDDDEHIENEQEGEIHERPSLTHRGQWGPSMSQLGTEGTVPPGQIAQLLILQQIYYHLSSVNAHYEEQECRKDVEDDWKYASMVIDRCCLFIFSGFIALSTLSLFASVPRLFETF